MHHHSNDTPVMRLGDEFMRAHFIVMIYITQVIHILW